MAGRLKLIDFGIASSVQSDMTSVMKDTQMGTFNFMSPEAIQDLSGGGEFYIVHNILNSRLPITFIHNFERFKNSAGAGATNW